MFLDLEILPPGNRPNPHALSGSDDETDSELSLEMTKKVLDLTSDKLGVPPEELRDALTNGHSIFTLGAESMIAMEIVAGLRKLDVDMSVLDIFRGNFDTYLKNRINDHSLSKMR